MTPFAAVVFLVVPNVNYEILILWEVVFLVKGNDTPPPCKHKLNTHYFRTKLSGLKSLCPPCFASPAPSPLLPTIKAGRLELKSWLCHFLSIESLHDPGLAFNLFQMKLLRLRV